MRTPLEYLKLLQSLLPKGWIWNRSLTSKLGEFLYGQADEFSRVDGRADDLLNERIILNSDELLLDHENDLGLPDDCSRDGETITERKRAAHSKNLTTGQQFPAYYIEIAAALGWTITIDQFQPFWCGYSQCGSSCGEQINLFYWRVNVNYGEENIIRFQCGQSACGDSLSYVAGLSTLQCLLNRYKPAHTQIIFRYVGPEFDNSFSSAFHALPVEDIDYLYGPFSIEFGNGFDVYNLGEVGAFNFEFSNAFDVNNASKVVDLNPAPEVHEPEFDNGFDTSFLAVLTEYTPEFTKEFSSAFDAKVLSESDYIDGPFSFEFGKGFNVNNQSEQGAFSHDFYKAFDVNNNQKNLKVGAFNDSFYHEFDVNNLSKYESTEHEYDESFDSSFNVETL